MADRRKKKNLQRQTDEKARIKTKGEKKREIAEIDRRKTRICRDRQTKEKEFEETERQKKKEFEETDRRKSENLQRQTDEKIENLQRQTDEGNINAETYRWKKENSQRQIDRRKNIICRCSNKRIYCLRQIFNPNLQNIQAARELFEQLTD